MSQGKEDNVVLYSLVNTDKSHDGYSKYRYCVINFEGKKDHL